MCTVTDCTAGGDYKTHDMKNELQLWAWAIFVHNLIFDHVAHTVSHIQEIIVFESAACKDISNESKFMHLLMANSIAMNC